MNDVVAAAASVHGDRSEVDGVQIRIACLCGWTGGWTTDARHAVTSLMEHAYERGVDDALYEGVGL